MCAADAGTAGDRHLEADPGRDMKLTFYLGVAAVEFKQYAAYVQRRTATRAAELRTTHAD